jgi:hypothetical protein
MSVESKAVWFDLRMLDVFHGIRVLLLDVFHVIHMLLLDVFHVIRMLMLDISHITLMLLRFDCIVPPSNLATNRFKNDTIQDIRQIIVLKQIINLTIPLFRCKTRTPSNTRPPRPPTLHRQALLRSPRHPGIVADGAWIRHAV